MQRSITVATLLSAALLGACVQEPDDSQIDPEAVGESIAAVSGRGYCSASGHPPTVYEPVYSKRLVPTRWCDNARVTGWFGAVLYAGTNWGVCQRGTLYGWVVWTQGDTGSAATSGWDWFPATSFSGGESGGPIPGLVNCSVYGF